MMFQVLIYSAVVVTREMTRMVWCYKLYHGLSNERSSYPASVLP